MGALTDSGFEATGLPSGRLADFTSAAVLSSVLRMLPCVSVFFLRYKGPFPVKPGMVFWDDPDSDVADSVGRRFRPEVSCLCPEWSTLFIANERSAEQS